MVLKNTRLVEIFIFSSYYNVNGISMARRYWKIPSSSFEVEAIPPPPSASPPEVGGIASTSQDSEGIFQYLLAMLMPLSQYHSSGEYLFFSILQWQWHRHGSEVLENTLLILRGRAIPPSSVGFASGHRGGYCPTPQDLEGIFQYLLAMPRPLSHYSVKQ